jgi:hypothetical protein
MPKIFGMSILHSHSLDEIRVHIDAAGRAGNQCVEQVMISESTQIRSQTARRTHSYRL